MILPLYPKRIESNIDLGSLSRANLFANEQHRRLIAFALANDHRPLDRQAIELLAHGVDRGLIGGHLVSAPAKPRRGHRRALGHTYKLKRQNNLRRLDDGCYKTLYVYLIKFRNVNLWFDNKPWKQLTKQDIKRVYDGLEDGKILTQAGEPFKDRRGYHIRAFLGLETVPVVQLEDMALDPERYQLPGDIHWNPAGHALVAQRLLEALIDAGTLAPCKA